MKLAAILITALVLSVFTHGCASLTPYQAAGKTLASTAVTVDKAMQGWARWVVMQRANPASDKATLAASEAKVRVLYGNYQHAMEVARLAYAAMPEDSQSTPAITSALTAVAACQSELLVLVQDLAK